VITAANYSNSDCTGISLGSSTLSSSNCQIPYESTSYSRLSCFSGNPANIPNTYVLSDFPNGDCSGNPAGTYEVISTGCHSNPVAAVSTYVICAGSQISFAASAIVLLFLVALLF